MPTKELVLKNTIPTSLFTTPYRFLRSTHLERDWSDPQALDGYVFTPYASEGLSRLSQGLRNGSSLRAWRITGDYGSGKSSFALLVASLFAGRTKGFSKDLLSQLRTSNPEILKSPKLLPVLVTGSREALGEAILRNVLKALKEVEVSARFLNSLATQLSAGEQLKDEQVVDWVKRSSSYVAQHKIASGILLILDEAGKFLEYASMRPDRQDIYLLQALAETASRNSSSSLFIISIFHQGIYAYAQSLTKPQQKEWEKVGGRFEEITWHYPVEQSFILITHAMSTQTAAVSKAILAQQKRDLERCLRLGWYGLAVNRDIIKQEAEGLYPLHPTVVPVLVKLFALYGQNERTLYSFLLGTEPFGLRDFVLRTEGKRVFRLNNLYDYVRSTFGARLSSLHYHWRAIDSVVENHATGDELSRALIKAIGIINLLNASDLVASPELLALAVGEDCAEELEGLQKKRLVYNRGREAGLGVWSNTNVNLEDAYVEAVKVLGTPRNIKLLLKDRIEERPIVARRHYIETGNLRYFNVRYVDVVDLQNGLLQPYSGDGLVLVPLCETKKDVQKAISFATALQKEHERVVIMIPPPLQGLSAYLEEVRRWEWIERSVPELRQDRLAREEVSRQLNLAMIDLQKHIDLMLGFDTLELESEQQWFYQGSREPHIRSGKAAISFLSRICDQVYSLSPHIQNELVNRRTLSSAAASARLRLCEQLLEFSDEPYLGMDSEKHPPEMSMYLSVLKASGLHACDEATGDWAVRLPEANFDREQCRVLPAMQRIHDLLLQSNTKRIFVTKLFDALAAPPYGVREGLMPVLLAVFSVLHEQELAYYEDGSFIPRLTGTVFLRLIKAPETFEVQYYPITGVRNALFHRLVQELEFKTASEDRVDILDIVRPLALFVGGLPEYVLKTNSLSTEAMAVRSILIKTSDPVKLLFTELPRACGLSPIVNHEKTDVQAIQVFAQMLKTVLDELRAAYPALLENVQKQLFTEFSLEGNFEDNRAALAERSSALVLMISEIGLKSFALRLCDQALAKDPWLEALGNLLASMPPAKWRDRDQQKFQQELTRLTQQFLRVEATVYSQMQHGGATQSIRVVLTLPNGEERGEVVHLNKEQEATTKQLEEGLTRVLEEHGQVGLAAASGVLWRLLKRNNTNGISQE